MSPFRKATLTALVLLIGMLTGCATVLQNLPAPPEFVSTLPLDGPYDKQIPDKLRGQLRGASLVTDWAVPYLFMNVGLHFEGQGDDVRALHFFDRAIAEFRKRNNGPGEGTAFNRRVFSLYAFGRIQEAFGAIREKEKSWNAAPMQAFVEYNYGHYFLMNGDYAKALGHYETALRLLAAAKDDRELWLWPAGTSAWTEVGGLNYAWNAKGWDGPTKAATWNGKAVALQDGAVTVTGPGKLIVDGKATLTVTGGVADRKLLIRLR